MKASKLMPAKNPNQYWKIDGWKKNQTQEQHNFHIVYFLLSFAFIFFGWAYKNSVCRTTLTDLCDAAVDAINAAKHRRVSHLQCRGLDHAHTRSAHAQTEYLLLFCYLYSISGCAFIFLSVFGFAYIVHLPVHGLLIRVCTSAACVQYPLSRYIFSLQSNFTASSSCIFFRYMRRQPLTHTRSCIYYATDGIFFYCCCCVICSFSLHESYTTESNPLEEMGRIEPFSNCVRTLYFQMQWGKACL